VPRAYHSGDYQEVDWILRRLRTSHSGSIHAVGVSLGGNALLRWAEETGEAASQTVTSLSAICSPIDLAAGGWSLGHGINRLVYTPMFLKTMKPKALQKLRQHPGLFDEEALNAVRTIYEFDNVFTAPLHGFRNTDDYWARASAKPRLNAIRVPTLLAHAHNDPFVPAWSLPAQREVGSHVTLWQPKHGGHVGFASGLPPGHLRTLPEQVGQWMSPQNR
jgi:predicted alpha/beta-fold hydrolase